MKKIFAGILGLGMAVGFTDLFYKIQDQSPSEPVSAKAPPPSVPAPAPVVTIPPVVVKPVTQAPIPSPAPVNTVTPIQTAKAPVSAVQQKPSIPQTTALTTPPAAAPIAQPPTQPLTQPTMQSPTLEIGRYIKETEKELVSINKRTAELDAEKSELSKRRDTLRKSLHSTRKLADIFDDAVAPHDEKERGVLIQIGSLISDLKDDESKKPFARVSQKKDVTLIHIDADRLFGRRQQLKLRPSQMEHLDTLVDELPDGVKLRNLTIYQSVDSAKGLTSKRAKKLAEYLEDHFGQSIDEIQVRLKRRATIPESSEFLLELSTSTREEETPAAQRSTASADEHAPSDKSAEKL